MFKNFLIIFLGIVVLIEYYYINEFEKIINFFNESIEIRDKLVKVITEYNNNEINITEYNYSVQQIFNEIEELERGINENY